MKANTENIVREAELEKVEREPEKVYALPEAGIDNSKENEKSEVVTAVRETGTTEQTETELLQSINTKLDLLLAAQQIKTE